MGDRGLDPLRSHAAFNRLLKSRELGRLVAERCLDRAWNLGEEGQRQLALLWFARGLEAAPADANDLARKIRWLCDNPLARQTFRTNARLEYTGNYSASQNYTQLMRIYNNVMNRTRGVSGAAAQEQYDA